MGKKSLEKKAQFQKDSANDAKHHKKMFEKISEDKQMRIFEVAAGEFAKKGFAAANINVIAKKSGISIGSMYNYFRSKEDLFLAISDQGYKILENVISTVDLDKGDIFDKIEQLLRIAQKFSREYSDLNKIYMDVTSEGLSHLSERLSRKMESITAKFYRTLLNDAKKSGEIFPDTDEYITSFCIDNLLLILQYSNTSEYFKERMRIFAGEDSFEDDEKIIQGMMIFIRRALGGEEHNRQAKKKQLEKK